MSAPDPWADEETAAAVALSLLPGMGPARCAAWLERCGTATAALASPDTAAFAGEKNVAAARTRARELLQRLAAAGTTAIARTSPGFPAALLRKAALRMNVPPYITVRGAMTELLTRPRVAVVGARHATRQGMRLAMELAAGLAARGVVVVSGYAAGIDGGAHAAAVQAGGDSLALLPCGMLQRNGPLAAVESPRLTLLSERHPDEPWNVGAALQRNGAIVCFAQLVIVVEGKNQGGTMHTAGKAAQLGLPLLTPRWPAAHPLREACEALLRQGVAAPLHDATPPRPDACIERALQRLSAAT